jgi:hypothetical protein
MCSIWGFFFLAEFLRSLFTLYVGSLLFNNNNKKLVWMKKNIIKNT